MYRPRWRGRLPRRYPRKQFVVCSHHTPFRRRWEDAKAAMCRDTISRTRGVLTPLLSVFKLRVHTPRSDVPGERTRSDGAVAALPVRITEPPLEQLAARIPRHFGDEVNGLRP